jgi:phosphoribosylformylglycinamidine synthase
MNVAVVVFPGSNADWDALHVARDVMGWNTRWVFHKETSLGDADLVILPGGFAHGDYLRCGAIARFSPIAPAIAAHAKRGGKVLGICNGFQVLTEMGLLPGALTRNAHLRFECRDVWTRVENEGAFTRKIPAGAVLRLPIAHAEGRYQCDDETLARLEGEGLVALRYVGPDGKQERDRWRLLARAERHGSDAAPRARLRARPRQRGRPADLRVGPRLIGHGPSCAAFGSAGSIRACRRPGG